MKYKELLSPVQIWSGEQLYRASSYTEMGFLHLKHMFSDISKQYPEVGFEENEM